MKLVAVNYVYKIFENVPDPSFNIPLENIYIFRSTDILLAFVAHLLTSHVVLNSALHLLLFLMSVELLETTTIFAYARGTFS